MSSVEEQLKSYMRERERDMFTYEQDISQLQRYQQRMQRSSQPLPQLSPSLPQDYMKEEQEEEEEEEEEGYADQEQEQEELHVGGLDEDIGMGLHGDSVSEEEGFEYEGLENEGNYTLHRNSEEATHRASLDMFGGAGYNDNKEEIKGVFGHHALKEYIQSRQRMTQ